MPSISRIRFTNVVYDNGKKRYIDTTFRFDGFNGILLLENGAGKTVFVQTLIQAVLPRKTVANRKIQETLCPHCRLSFPQQQRCARIARICLRIPGSGSELHREAPVRPRG